ncbi:hypothetical protein DVH24_010756 [Malus domestica]|uniref:Uncharacterized protein n=1 Tax=Malus domestica TaxID=3750 RepID=A0A498JZ30_MALDO|nr:hypothetical protein DVH24_010756 [Malus domestica]
MSSGEIFQSQVRFLGRIELGCRNTHFRRAVGVGGDSDHLRPFHDEMKSRVVFGGRPELLKLRCLFSCETRPPRPVPSQAGLRPVWGVKPKILTQFPFYYPKGLRADKLKA